VPIYRARFVRDVPIQWRICTSFAPDPAAIPTGVPSSPMYPGGFMWTLVKSKLATMLCPSSP
jgi:hypothetical protein